MQTTLAIEEAPPITLESMTSETEMLAFKNYCMQSVRAVKSSEPARKHYEGLIRAVEAHEELRRLMQVWQRFTGPGASLQNLTAQIESMEEYLRIVEEEQS